MWSWSIVAASGKERTERMEEERARRGRVGEFWRRYRRKEPVVFQ